VNDLLDSCVLSELVKQQPEPSELSWVAARAENELFVSALTLAELHRGVRRLPESRLRAELSHWLAQLEQGFEGRVLPFTLDTAHAWAQITTQAEQHDKPMAAFDSLIAATAKAHALRLVTRNVRDFAASGVPLLNPWTDERG
jgi:toxin FitB